MTTRQSSWTLENANRKRERERGKENSHALHSFKYKCLVRDETKLSNRV